MVGLTNDRSDEEGGGSAWSETVSLLAEAWMAWSVGRHIGQVRAMTETVETARASAGGGSAALVAPTAPRLQRLDRVVEHVMESEIQAGTAVTAARRAAPKRGGRVAAARRLKAWKRDHARR